MICLTKCVLKSMTGAAQQVGKGSLLQLGKAPGAVLWPPAGGGAAAALPCWDGGGNRVTLRGTMEKPHF